MMMMMMMFIAPALAKGCADCRAWKAVHSRSAEDGMVKVFEARRLRRQPEGAEEAQALLATYTDHSVRG